MNNQALLLWKEIFGSDKTPNDCEIIGVDNDGTLISYHAKDGSCYNFGVTVAQFKEEDGKANEREHIILNPLAYVALLRMHLKGCHTPKTARGMRRDNEGWKRLRIEKINDIVEQALKIEPDKKVNDLAKEGEYQRLKAQKEAYKSNGVAGDHAIMTNEPHLRGEDGRLISLAEFERRCHILRAEKLSNIHKGERKFCVLFGRDPINMTWMYSIGMYGHTRKEIVKRAFNAVKLWNLNRQVEPLAANEYFDSHFNRKIPLSF